MLVDQPDAGPRRARRIGRLVAAFLLGGLSVVGALPLETVAALRVAVGL